MNKIDLHQDIILSFHAPFEDFGDKSKVNDVEGTYAGNLSSYLSTDLKIVFAANRPYQLTGHLADVVGRNITYSQEVFEEQQKCTEELIQRYDLGVILSVQDLLPQKGLSLLLHVEGVDHQVTLQDIRNYFARGIRSLGFVRNFDNALAHNNTTVHKSGGLSPLGRQVVGEMNRLCMLIDTAHMNHTSMMDVAALSTKPILNSHSNLKHFCAHTRNVEDDFLYALQKNGGVLGLSVYQDFVGSADMEAYLDQIAYVIDLIGPDHVALGTDFHGLPTEECLTGLKTINDLPALESAIIKRFGQEIAAKFFRSNAIRVLQANLPKTA